MCLYVDLDLTKKYISSPKKSIIAYKNVKVYDFSIETPYRFVTIKPNRKRIISLTPIEEKKAIELRNQLIMLSSINESYFNKFDENGVVRENALHLYTNEHYTSRLDNEFTLKVIIKPENIIAVGHTILNITTLAVTKYQITKNSWKSIVEEAFIKPFIH